MIVLCNGKGVLGFYCNHFMTNLLTTIITTSHSLLRGEIAVLQMNDSHIKAVRTTPIYDLLHYTPHLLMIGRVLPIGLYQTSAGWIALSLMMGKEVEHREGAAGRVQVSLTGLDEYHASNMQTGPKGFWTEMSTQTKKT